MSNIWDNLLVFIFNIFILYTQSEVHPVMWIIKKKLKSSLNDFMEFKIGIYKVVNK